MLFWYKDSVGHTCCNHIVLKELPQWDVTLDPDLDPEVEVVDDAIPDPAVEAGVVAAVWKMGIVYMLVILVLTAQRRRLNEHLRSLVQSVKCG